MRYIIIVFSVLLTACVTTDFIPDSIEQLYDDPAILEKLFEDPDGFSSLLVSGCVRADPRSSECLESTAPTSETRSKLYKNYSMLLILSEAPIEFSAQTPLSTATQGSYFGEAVSKRHDFQLDGLKDPALRDEKRLGEVLSDALKLSLLEDTMEAERFYNMDMPNAELAKTLMFDITTTQWGYRHYPLNLTRFKLLYSARYRLIDGATGGVLVDYQCELQESHNKPDKAYKHEDFMKGNVEKISANFDQLISKCSDEFINQSAVLNLNAKAFSE